MSRDLYLLRRAICENPAENTPRLAYADAIEEIGGKGHAQHARMIRLQVGRRVWDKRPVGRGLLRSLVGDDAFAALFTAGGRPVSARAQKDESFQWSVQNQQSSSLTLARGFSFRWVCDVHRFTDLAGVVFDANPITQVGLFVQPGRHGDGSFWVNESRFPGMQGAIPEELFARLPHPRWVVPNLGIESAWYPDRTAGAGAPSALSYAATVWGREMAISYRKNRGGV